MSLAATAAGLLLAAAPITIVDEAGVPAAELDSIRAGFAAWHARVHAYHDAPATPVTVKLTRDVPFGFYRDGVVLLPPNEDRQAMLEDWVHELTHHVIGRGSSFFFREGTATHTVDALLAADGRVVHGWPNFGRTCDEWTALFASRKKLPPLADMLAWPRYRGETAEQDFRSWQIYLAAGSFVGWYRQRHGVDGFRDAFARQWPIQDSAQAQAEWLRWLAERKLPGFEPEAVLPMKSRRYRAYAKRLAAP